MNTLSNRKSKRIARSIKIKELKTKTKEQLLKELEIHMSFINEGNFTKAAKACFGLTLSVLSSKFDYTINFKLTKTAEDNFYNFELKN